MGVAERSCAVMIQSAVAQQQKQALDSKAGGKPKILCVFNYVGGGAFLRGAGKQQEATATAAIPALLAAGFVRARAKAQVPAEVQLLIVGPTSSTSDGFLADTTFGTSPDAAALLASFAPEVLLALVGQQPRRRFSCVLVLYMPAR